MCANITMLVAFDHIFQKKLKIYEGDAVWQEQLTTYWLR